MRIHLISDNREMCHAWREAFKDAPNVIVYHGDFFALPTDIVVSPANSFGFMDGGLDRAIAKRLNIRRETKIQNEVYDRIATLPMGELVVGNAIAVATHGEVKWLIVAPTMRVPMRLPTDTVNPFLATKAALLEGLKVCVSKSYNVYPSGGKSECSTLNDLRITLPAFGAGIGGIPVSIVAKQMRQAYGDVFRGTSHPQTFAEAQKRHCDLLATEYIDLQKPHTN